MERSVWGVTISTKSNQWRSTSEVIVWFKALPDKPRTRFIKFDICEYYQSISEQLLDKAIAYARLHTHISDNEIKIIKHARKSLIFCQNTEWVKKNSQNDLFDVTMDSFDGAELCELVGLYLLHKLEPLIGTQNTGLYRDDGLTAIRSQSARRLDRLRKDIIAAFQLEGLSITCESNLIITDFLDITLDLGTGKFSPYRKPGNKLLYVNAKSNHPPTVIKEIPRMIEKRLSDLSYNEQEFDKVKSTYEEALTASGHQSKLQFQQPSPKRKNRHRSVTWFCPPYSESAKTPIRKVFLQLLCKHFPPEHRYARIMNKNTIKMSYSCMPNMQNIMKQKNENLLKETPEADQRMCNCSTVEDCPLNGLCLTTNLIYTADVSYKEHNEEKHAIYHGSTRSQFKTRWTEHKSSF